jgi:DNA-binding response OmpR family regulator
MVEKILIVDDDIQTLHLVGLMLEKQGYRILAANTGIQAITLAHSEHPDAIILDVMMPDYDGYEISRRLRKDSETLHIPILIFSARTQVKIVGVTGADDT